MRVFKGLLIFTLFLVVELSLISLCVWQTKRHFSAVELTEKIKAGEQKLANLESVTISNEYATVKLNGEFDYSGEMLLAGQSVGGKSAYRFVVPFIIYQTSKTVLVDTGLLRKELYKDKKSLQQWHGLFETNVTGVVRFFKDKTSFWRSPKNPIPSDVPIILTLEQGKADYPFYIQAKDIEYIEDECMEEEEYPVAQIDYPLGKIPHLQYAITWGLSALIFLVMSGLLFIRSRKKSKQIYA